MRFGLHLVVVLAGLFFLASGLAVGLAIFLLVSGVLGFLSEFLSASATGLAAASDDLERAVDANLRQSMLANLGVADGAVCSFCGRVNDNAAASCSGCGAS